MNDILRKYSYCSNIVRDFSFRIFKDDEQNHWGSNDRNKGSICWGGEQRILI